MKIFSLSNKSSRRNSRRGRKRITWFCGGSLLFSYTLLRRCGEEETEPHTHNRLECH